MSSMDTTPEEKVKKDKTYNIEGNTDNQIHIEKLEESPKAKPKEVLDENLLTLHKIHSILLNCINLSKKNKLEFANSQRYFMKLYLKKLREELDKE
ncbi:hypothetical protein LCGC14_1346510 [marine sediment metagenome]|uniref:Uncharacterized protein n=1 Tax=marine sediment metagenome TaxID=412755 RepID=A0A0F9KCU6_9ZZZZ|nr:hypothetical protein [bacterium]